MEGKWVKNILRIACERRNLSKADTSRMLELFDVLGQIANGLGYCLSTEADLLSQWVAYAVRDFRRGTLPTDFTNSPEAMKWIREMAALFPITASSEFKDFVAKLSKEDAAEFWRDRNRIANFLKHADQDHNAHVVLQDVDNLSLLGMALCAYVDLTNDLIHPEGLVLWMYLNVGKDMKESLSEEIRRLVEEVEEIDVEDRADFCAALIKQIREN
jgi:hypothetical protein